MWLLSELNVCFSCCVSVTDLVVMKHDRGSHRHLRAARSSVGVMCVTHALGILLSLHVSGFLWSFGSSFVHALLLYVTCTFSFDLHGFYCFNLHLIIFSTLYIHICIYLPSMYWLVWSISFCCVIVAKLSVVDRMELKSMSWMWSFCSYGTFVLRV